MGKIKQNKENNKKTKPKYYMIIFNFIYLLLNSIYYSHSVF